MKGIVLVGAGSMGEKRCLAISNHSQSELRYVIDIQPDRAKELAERYGAKYGTDLEVALSSPQIDAVVISVIHRDLVSIALTALKAGKHVFVEKPVALNYEEALQLEKVIQLSKSQFRVGYTLRSFPLVQEVKRVLTNGELGRLFTIRMLYGHGGRENYNKEWRFNKSLSGGGQLVDQGSHLIDLALWTLEPIKEVQANLSTFFWDNKDGVEDYSHVTLKSETGQIAELTASWVQWRNHFSCQWICEKGYLSIEGLNGSYGEQKLTIGKRYSLGARPHEIIRTSPGIVPFQEEWNQFMNALDGAPSVLSQYQEALNVLEVISLSYRAAHLKASVNLQEGAAE